MLLSIYDRDLRRVAALQNAYDRVVEERLEGIGSLSFSLPGDDPKAALLRPSVYVRAGEDGDFYRVLTCTASEDGAGAALRCEAEHALATLCDEVLFQTHVLGGEGVPTRAVLEAILRKQQTRHWRLDACDFAEELSYCFSSENLLSALFAVARVLAAPYRWQTDMRVYPWRISLKKLNEASAPVYPLRAGRNLLATSDTQTARQVCTRLYALGSGEGAGQVTIAPVNGGVPYVQSAPAVVAEHGLISRVFVDRSIDDALTLKARAVALLAQLETPQRTRTFQAADLRAISARAWEVARPGDLLLLEADGTRAYVTAVRRNLDVAGDMTIEISTSPCGLAEDLAELAHRQQVEAVHAQGAMTLCAVSRAQNATARVPAEVSVRIPGSMVAAHRVLARVRLAAFRMYERPVQAAGQTLTTRLGGSGGGQHNHDVYVPVHRHETEAGIFTTGKATNAQVLVDGRAVMAIGQEAEVDLTVYLGGESGAVPKERWVRIGVLPNDLAYVSVDVMVEGFVRP